MFNPWVLIEPVNHNVWEEEFLNNACKLIWELSGPEGAGNRAFKVEDGFDTDKGMSVISEDGSKSGLSSFWCINKNNFLLHLCPGIYFHHKT